MSTYYAITRHGERWVYVYSGQDPHEVYQTAIDILDERRNLAGDDVLALSPDSERQIDTLRVVPEELARQQFHVVLPRERTQEV